MASFGSQPVNSGLSECQDAAVLWITSASLAAASCAICRTTPLIWGCWNWGSVSLISNQLPKKRLLISPEIRTDGHKQIPGMKVYEKHWCWWSFCKGFFQGIKEPLVDSDFPHHYFSYSSNSSELFSTSPDSSQGQSLSLVISNQHWQNHVNKQPYDKPFREKTIRVGSKLGRFWWHMVFGTFEYFWVFLARLSHISTGCHFRHKSSHCESQYLRVKIKNSGSLYIHPLEQHTKKKFAIGCQQNTRFLEKVTSNSRETRAAFKFFLAIQIRVVHLV